MRLRHVIIPAMAAALIVHLSGCGKHESAWIEPPQISLRVNDRQGMSSSKTVVSESRNNMDVLRKRGASIEQIGLLSVENSRNIQEDFLDRLFQWKEKRSSLPDTIVVPKPMPKSGKPLEAEIPFAPEPARVLEYSYPTELLNLKIKVQLLEYRLKTAKVQDKAVIEAELAAARQSLDEAEQKYSRLVTVSQPEPILPITADDDLQERPNTVINVGKYDETKVVEILRNLKIASIGDSKRIVPNPDMSGLDRYAKLEIRTSSLVDNSLSELMKMHK